MMDRPRPKHDPAYDRYLHPFYSPDNPSPEGCKEARDLIALCFQAYLHAEQYRQELIERCKHGVVPYAVAICKCVEARFGEEHRNKVLAEEGEES